MTPFTTSGEGDGAGYRPVLLPILLPTGISNPHLILIPILSLNLMIGSAPPVSTNIPTLGNSATYFVLEILRDAIPRPAAAPLGRLGWVRF
jgi:TRAP-type C4-dicarboxylate transport system permease large subunit